MILIWKTFKTSLILRSLILCLCVQVRLSVSSVIPPVGRVQGIGKTSVIPVRKVRPPVYIFLICRCRKMIFVKCWELESLCMFVCLHRYVSHQQPVVCVRLSTWDSWEPDERALWRLFSRLFVLSGRTSLSEVQKCLWSTLPAGRQMCCWV